MDGSTVLDSNESSIPTYDNSDIQTFARAWTGFNRQDKRSNIENSFWALNRIDPMVILGEMRDVFPKMDLDGGFIGYAYPLCVQLPNHQFLRKGTIYRLLGKFNFPELHSDPNN